MDFNTKLYVYLKGKEFLLQFYFNQSLINLVKQIPGRRAEKKENKWFWYVPVTPISVQKLNDLPCRIEWSEKSIETIKILNENFAMSSKEESNIDIPAPDGLEYLPFQKAGIEFIERNMGKCLISDEAGLGKGHPKNTPILTSTGWKEIGELKIKDEIIGSDGKSHQVTGIYPRGTLPVYKVSFCDGSFVLTDEDHLWSVKTQNDRQRKGKEKIIKTKDLKHNIHKNLSIPTVKPVIFSKQDKALSIDPYILGTWIADGSKHTHTFNFTTGDENVTKEIQKRLPDWAEIAEIKQEAHCISYRIKKKGGNTKPNPYIESLKKMNLLETYSKERFIPEEYMFSSPEERLDLLHGLMDGDGEYRKKDHHTEYCSMSLELVKQIQELARGLGFYAGPIREKKPAKIKGKEFEKSYRVSLRRTKEKSLFKIRETKEEEKIKYKQHRLIKSIEPAGIEEVVCISVSAPDSLYVTKDFIVTHNTIQVLGYLNLHPEFKRILIVCPSIVKYNWELEINKWTKRKTEILEGRKERVLNEDKIYIINYDILGTNETIDIPVNKRTSQSTYKKVLKRLVYLNNFDIIIFDECFLAGTKISTPRGEKNIEEIKIGDEVYNASGIGIVKNTIKRKSSDLIKIYLSNKKTIICTKNHPIFTEDGWIKAEDCLGKKVFSSKEVSDIMSYNINSENKIGEKHENKIQKDLSRMQNFFSWSKKPKILFEKMFGKFQYETASYFKKNKREKIQTPNTKDLSHLQQNFHSQKQKNSKILQSILFSEMDTQTTRNPRKKKKENNFRKNFYLDEKSLQRKSRIIKKSFQENDRKQSYQNAWSERENQRDIQKTGTSFTKTTIERRKRKASPTSTKNIMGCSRTRLENRIYNTNKNEKGNRLSRLLQSRYSIPKKENMDRSKWMVSPNNKRCSRERPEENRIPQEVRVERIESYQSRSRRKFNKDNTKNKEQFVFNLEVSNHPSYYAEGSLVHNCQNLRNTTTIKTKISQKLCKETNKTIFLSATPIKNRPIELFPVLNMLSPKQFNNYIQFAYRYCGAKKTRWGLEVNGSSNITELSTMLRSTLMIRREKKDVLKELPSVRTSVIPIKINLKEYKKVEESFGKWLMETEGYTKSIALSKIEKLKQTINKSKINGCIDWIKNFLENDEKLVVFAHHKNMINQLESKLKDYNPVVIRGGDNPKDRQRSIENFQKKEKHKVIILSLLAGGVGITLTASSNVCFTELVWTPADHDQGWQRVHRIGQEMPVNVYYFIGMKTIEENIYQLLEDKRKIFSQIFNLSEHPDTDMDIFKDFIKEFSQEKIKKPNEEKKEETFSLLETRIELKPEIKKELSEQDRKDTEDFLEILRKAEEGLYKISL